jgi:hypothetical protein
MSFLGFADGKMDSNAERRSGVDLAGPSDDVDLRIVVKVAFCERRRIE